MGERPRGRRPAAPEPAGARCTTSPTTGCTPALTGAEHARLVADESLLLRDAAHVVVCSPALLAAKRPARQDRALSLVPNAVDVDAYRDPGPRPADLPRGAGRPLRRHRPLRPRRPRPVRQHRPAPGGRGPPSSSSGRPPSTRPSAAGSRRPASCSWGRAHSAVVPAYLTHADVLLVPHVVTPFTDSLDPIKLYEYRAAEPPGGQHPGGRVPGGRRPAGDTGRRRGLPCGRRPRPGAGITLRAFREKCHTSNPFVGRFGPLRCGPCWTTLPRGGRPRSHPTVAIAHDYLTQRGGAERVVLAMHRAFPDATIYTTLYEPDHTYPEFRDARIVTSALNDVPALRRHHRTALPLLPFAARSMRITEDVVLASSSGWAHGFSATGRRLVYCHAPARWLYQAEAYLGAAEHTQSVRGLAAPDPHAVAEAVGQAARARRGRLPRELAGGPRPDARGLRDRGAGPARAARDGHRTRRRSRSPPWTGGATTTSSCHGCCRTRTSRRRWRPSATCPSGSSSSVTVRSSGPSSDGSRPTSGCSSNLTDAQLRWVYARSRALVAPSLEDYGLTPLEAAAYGKPTLALGAGGYLDTVVPGTTGLFFSHPTPREIRSAVLAARTREWSEVADPRPRRAVRRARVPRGAAPRRGRPRRGRAVHGGDRAPDAAAASTRPGA